MVRRLHLQGCACGHGGSAWVALPAAVHYSLIESSHCPPRIWWKLFGRAVSATGAGTIVVILSTPLCCARDDNRYVMFDLLVSLANGQSIMGDHSQEEQALLKIQHEWAEARIKGDSSYTRRIEADDCTIVWPDGRIVDKRQDLQTMTGDIVFSEFKIDDVRGTHIWRDGNRRRRRHH